MKSTNNLTPQFWGSRKPMTHYFANCHVSFTIKRKTKDLEYKLCLVTGYGQSTLMQGKVRDEGHLKHLLSCKTIEDVMHSNEILSRKEIEN